MSIGQGWGGWPVLLVLLAAVLVPTACVLWFMNAAMRNETLAVRQKLTDIYQADASEIQKSLEQYFSAKLTALEELADSPAPQLFADCVRTGLADSVIIFDDAGKLAYPTTKSTILAQSAELSHQWQQAQELEFRLAENDKAADAYATIAADAPNENIKAMALQAQARCLVKAGQKEKAFAILSEQLAEPTLENARDAHGRLIGPNATLLALQLIHDEASDEFGVLAEEFVKQLNDYSGPQIPSSQRRFLMRELLGIYPQADVRVMLEAEKLAAHYLQAKPPPAESFRILPAKLPAVSHILFADGRAVAIFTTSTLMGQMDSAAKLNEPRADAAFVLLPPGRSVTPKSFLTIPAGDHLPSWQLTVHLLGEHPFTAAAATRKTAYLLTALIGISIIAVLAFFVAQYLGRQIKLTRLRNDLIATVSHELKTPLASMRVLVDTLLEGRYQDQQQARDYFRLISKENERLSRLIDNFLTFSRMERNKKAFDFDQLDLREVVLAALDSVADRFKKADCHLDVDIAPNLSTISGDRDALITVLLNLLDNAYKYSQDEKRVTVRAYPANGNVCLAVTDNGIGLSRRAIKKIFNRFYQVDQSLARKAGGCGLGLSIVKFIVDGHGGSIDVVSQPERGSTFTVKLPISSSETPTSQGSS